MISDEIQEQILRISLDIDDSFDGSIGICVECSKQLDTTGSLPTTRSKKGQNPLFLYPLKESDVQSQAFLSYGSLQRRF